MQVLSINIYVNFNLNILHSRGALAGVWGDYWGLRRVRRDMGLWSCGVLLGYLGNFDSEQMVDK